MFLSYLRDDKIVFQVAMPTDLTTEQVIDLDTFLRMCGIIDDSQEIAVTETLE